MKSLILLLALSLGSTSGQMYVESYWESWILKDYPNDYCALLRDVPATPVGSLTGANYISIGIALRNSNILKYIVHFGRNSVWRLLWRLWRY